MWKNTYARVFAINHCEDRDRDIPEYLSVVSIRDIRWGTEIKSVCHYCGSQVAKNTCPGCGSRHPGRSKYNLGGAVATLMGRLPYASSIFWLKDGAILDVSIDRCGRPDVYHEEKIKFRLLGCKIISRSIPVLVAMLSDETSTVDLYVDISCEVELYPDGMGMGHEA